MDTEKLLKEVFGLIDLATLPEGPDTKDQTIALAQAYAQIAIAQELSRLNEQLASVIGTSNSGQTKWIETYDNSPRP